MLASFADMIAADAAAEKSRPAAEPYLVSTWTDGGYMARIVITACACGQRSKHLDGLFHIDIDKRTGGRRLTTLGRNPQFPPGEHTAEYVTIDTSWCAHCIPDLGFSKAVHLTERQQPYSLTIREE